MCHHEEPSIELDKIRGKEAKMENKKLIVHQNENSRLYMYRESPHCFECRSWKQDSVV